MLDASDNERNEEMRVEVRDGPYSLTARVVPMGNDLCVAVTGGLGHVGCAAVAVPHLGLTDPAQTSATVSTLNVTGHRDGMLAERISKRLSASLNCIAAVVCGVHFDGLEQREITRITKLADNLSQTILDRLKRADT